MQKFAQACAAWLADRPEPVCRQAARELQDAVAANQTTEPRTGLPEPRALAWLQPLLETPNCSALAEPLAAVGEDLGWFEPPGGNMEKHMGGRNCMTQLYGPSGRDADSGIRFGTFLLGPGAFYPRHVHGAEELYLVIAGSGRWSYDGAPYVAHGPGEVVHSRSWQPHAIRTDDQALLMAWMWMGDISFDSSRMEAELGDPEDGPS